MKSIVFFIIPLIITIFLLSCNHKVENNSNESLLFEKTLTSDTQFIAFSEKTILMQKYLESDYFGFKKIDTTTLRKNKTINRGRLKFVMDSLGAKHVDEYIMLRSDIGKYTKQLLKRYPQMTKIDKKKLFELCQSVSGK